MEGGSRRGDLREKASALKRPPKKTLWASPVGNIHCINRKAGNTRRMVSLRLWKATHCHIGVANLQKAERKGERPGRERWGPSRGGDR